MAFIPAIGAAITGAAAGSATAVAAGTLAVGAAAYGATNIISGMNQPKMPGAPAAPATPSVGDAAAAAQQAEADRRRAILAGGGQTDITGGQGWPALQGSTQKPTLLGGF